MHPSLPNDLLASSSQPWFTESLRTARRACRQAESTYRSTHSSSDHFIFRSLRNQYHNLSMQPRELTTHSWSNPHRIVLDANGAHEIIFCIVNRQVYFRHLFLCLILPFSLQQSSKTKSHNSAWHSPPTLLGLLTILHLWYHLQTSASFLLQPKMNYWNWFLIIPTNSVVSMPSQQHFLSTASVSLPRSSLA